MPDVSHSIHYNYIYTVYLVLKIFLFSQQFVIDQFLTLVNPVELNAKQKHLGCKKVQGQSEATLQTGRRDQKV